MNPKLNNKKMECTAPLNDYCSPEETYPDCKNCKYYKIKRRTLMKPIREFFYLLFAYILFRVKYIEKEDGTKGYFLLKREWVWLIFFPIIVIFAILKAIYYSFLDIFSHDLQWISKDKKKLTLIEKLYYTDRLLD